MNLWEENFNFNLMKHLYLICISTKLRLFRVKKSGMEDLSKNIQYFIKKVRFAFLLFCIYNISSLFNMLLIVGFNLKETRCDYKEN